MWRRNPNLQKENERDLLTIFERTDSDKLIYFRDIILNTPDMDLRPGSLAWHIVTYVDSKRWYKICA